MPTLTIGDVLYTPTNTSSVLLTRENYYLHDTLPGEHYHTSLGDIGAKDIIELLPYAEQINFVDDHFDVNSDIYKETLALLNYISHRHAVTGFDRSSVNNFVDDLEIYNRPNQPVLWVYGCSHSFGVGLDSKELLYANLMSQALELPLKLVARPGSSTQWSFRHLMNSCLQPGDTVVWQLTTPERLTRFEPDNDMPIETQLAKSHDRYLLEVFNDQQIFFQHINMLNAGVQYLRSQNVNFVLTSLLTQNKMFYRYLSEYTKYPEYCYSPGYNVDLGNDDCHIGPQSHKNLAQALLNHLEYKL